MSIRQTVFVLVSIFLLSACGSPPETAAPTSTSAPLTDAPSPIPSTEAPPVPARDPALFGAIGLNEIQAFALEPVASEIFTRAMNGFLADDRILDYQIVGVTIFPGGGGLLAEITYNVKTADPAWFAQGDTPAADDWINDKCNRFDFVTTEAEYQLKNRRLCN